MGSVASYEASVVAVYKRKIKITKPNTQEEIEKFLKSKKGVFGKVSKEEILMLAIEAERTRVGNVTPSRQNTHPLL